MENEKIKEKVKNNLKEDIAINFFIRENIEQNKTTIYEKIKKVIITFLTIIFGTGLVFATSQNVYKKIFKKPVQITRSEIQREITEISENDRSKINISEEEAQEIGMTLLKKLNYYSEFINIKSIKLKKFIEDPDTIYYQMNTSENYQEGIEILVNATNKQVEMFTDWDFKNTKYSSDNIKEEEAIELAKETINLYLHINLEEYEINEIQEHESTFNNETRHNWYISFCKNYSGIKDENESISLFFFVMHGDVKINDFRIMHDNMFKDSEIIISKEKAIQIAKNKEVEFSNIPIKNISVETKIENVNSKIYELENNIEVYELIETNNEITVTRKEEQYYKNEDIRRKVWKVTIEHKEINQETKSAESITEYIRKYYDKVYYIDTETGEIIGGEDNFATGKYAKELLKRQVGEEKYNKILEKYSRKIDVLYVED